MDLAPHHDTLRMLTRTDPDPQVRHRAAGLLLVAGGMAITTTAQPIGRSHNSLRTWGQRFLVGGRAGLVDRRRAGRPPKLGGEARELLETTLAASPLEYDYPVTTWTVAGLTDLLSRHDLTQRQDADAVVSAQHALTELQTRGCCRGWIPAGRRR